MPESSLKHEHATMITVIILNVVPTKEPTELFFIIPVTDSVKRIIEENWALIEKYKSDHTDEEGKYCDICCGELYRYQNAPAVKSRSQFTADSVHFGCSK